MNACKHRNLLLLPAPKDRIRCRHCHLTIKRDELTGRFCPECYERTGIKRNNFEEAVDTGPAKVQYMCEDCQMTWTG